MSLISILLRHYYINHFYNTTSFWHQCYLFCITVSVFMKDYVKFFYNATSFEHQSSQSDCSA